MSDRSVLFDEEDPHCPVCGSENVGENEEEIWESVWSCNDCGRWGRQSGYKGETPISHSA